MLQGISLYLLEDFEIEINLSNLGIFVQNFDFVKIVYQWMLLNDSNLW